MAKRRTISHRSNVRPFLTLAALVALVMGALWLATGGDAVSVTALTALTALLVWFQLRASMRLAAQAALKVEEGLRAEIRELQLELATAVAETRLLAHVLAEKRVIDAEVPDHIRLKAEALAASALGDRLDTGDDARARPDASAKAAPKASAKPPVAANAAPDAISDTPDEVLDAAARGGSEDVADDPESPDVFGDSDVGEGRELADGDEPEGRPGLSESDPPAAHRLPAGFKAVH